MEFSSCLLHRWPNPDNHRSYNLKWASTHILEELVNLMNDQAWGKILEKLVHKGVDVVRRPLFELYVFHIFRKGGYTFEVKELGEGIASQLSIPTSPPIKLFQKLEEFSAPTDGNLLIPTILNLPYLDAFLAPDGLFQVTVSSDHSVKQELLGNIAISILGNNWETTNKELKLYFVVPSDIYDDFAAQKNQNMNGKASEKAMGVVKRVKQYALKFDLKATSIELII